MTKKKRSISIVFILLMLCRLTTFSQTVIDSLLVELNKVGTTEDSIRIYLSLSETEEDGPMSLNYAYQALDNLNEIDNSELFVTAYQSIGHALEKVNLLDSAKLFYKKALTLADSIQNTSKSALIHLDLGDLENTRGNNAAALRHFTTANNYFDTPSHLDSAWFSLNRLGIVYNEMGLYAKSLEYYLKAYQLIQDSDDNNAKLILLNNLGIIYNEIGKPEDSKEYYNRGLEIAKAYGVSDKEAVLLSNLSIVYKEQRDTLGALDLIRKSHAIQVENNFTCGLAYSYEGLGEIMTWKREYDSARYFFEQAMNWANTCQLTGCQTSIYRNMGLLAMKQRKNRTAETMLLKSLDLASKANYAFEMKETAKGLFEFYKSKNDLKNALKYQLEYSDIKDSLFNAQSTEKIARMTAEYDFKREMESLKYKKMAEEMRLNEELREEQSFQNSILVVLVLTTLLAASLGRSYYLLQNHNKKLTVLNEEKNTLMGVVAHDLRSPLNNIKGLIALVKMEKSSLTPEQSHYFHLVDDTMERMRDMIDRVLDVSVVEDMKVNLNLKKVDLGQTMNFVAGNFELLASKKSIAIQSNIDTEKHFIFADYNYLLQVIENLLSNAIKFSESGKSIFLNVFQEDGSETMIIRDEGPGISEEDQPKLFTKFQKLSAKPTNNEQSTGLGLSIVKKFVDAMEAEISCESEVGVGTSFIVRFKSAVEEELV